MSSRMKLIMESLTFELMKTSKQNMNYSSKEICSPRKSTGKAKNLQKYSIDTEAIQMKNKFTYRLTISKKGKTTIPSSTAILNSG